MVSDRLGGDGLCDGHSPSVGLRWSGPRKSPGRTEDGPRLNTQGLGEVCDWEGRGNGKGRLVGPRKNENIHTYTLILEFCP